VRSSPDGPERAVFHRPELASPGARAPRQTRRMFEDFATVADRAGTALHLPRASADATEAVLAHLLDMCGRLPEVRPTVSMDHAAESDGDAVPSHGEVLMLIVPLLETCLEADADEPAPPLVAQLAFMAALPAVPESIALQVAFGRRVGEAQTREFGRLIARARQRGVSVDEYVANLVAADALPRGTLVRLFHGESRRTPDAARVKRGIAMLRGIASLVPPMLRPPLLCTIAWLHWAGGKRALAAAYLAEASRIDPENVLAYGLSWLISTKIPSWLAPKSPSIPRQ
jgi:hypothetical protein